MNTLIICLSVHHGNTEKIARVIAESNDARILKPDEFDINRLYDYDLIGFGSGIFYFKHHKALLDLADKMPLTDKKAFIFSTSGVGSTIFHKHLRDKLSKKGFIIAGEFSCKGFDTWGPYKLLGGRNKGKPDENDLENARNFARNMAKVRL